MSRRTKALVAAIAVWHLCCLALIAIYPTTFGRAVQATLSYWYGDIQSSFGTYSRLAAYIGIIIITTPATAMGLGVFDTLTPAASTWWRRAATFVGWQAAVVAALALSYEVSFHYLLNQIGWVLFGPPDSVYSFRNLVLPRLVAWMVCTTPPALVALWLHSGGWPLHGPRTQVPDRGDHNNTQPLT